MVRIEQDGALISLHFLPPYAAEDERLYLDALGRVGRHAQRFALLAVFGGSARLSQAAEREQALWFKATRSHFNSLCQAIALVRPGASEKMATTFRRLWSIPLEVFEDEAEARLFLARHLDPLVVGGSG
ncbi:MULTISPECIES: hypothetical protein [unclassified Chelatococcus]|uniref:hypothetical protein n=1 Tax=unclassified Chelatococcus TaxID=2638111 RepID=UPI001BCB183D|nr:MULTISPECIES: hypothetical protein [unclassified Chelatococcus]MBS7698369.1 hypothetical protein [Chelatococcus sp. YT9]MBX3558864.1 hypothetical protein [Chelatococcus sp.]